mmetsp:Transcript_31044/g.83371  ORF Transcript_31044/g.83371 Transcript_31044/m.83371 type:complete len:219 (-) Transcript_31044:294-950(-)
MGGWRGGGVSVGRPREPVGKFPAEGRQSCGQRVGLKGPAPDCETAVLVQEVGRPFPRRRRRKGRGRAPAPQQQPRLGWMAGLGGTSTGEAQEDEPHAGEAEEVLAAASSGPLALGRQHPGSGALLHHLQRGLGDAPGPPVVRGPPGQVQHPHLPYQEQVLPRRERAGRVPRPAAERAGRGRARAAHHRGDPGGRLLHRSCDCCHHMMLIKTALIIVVM